ncbi:MAG TPA: hypothetical protein VHK69_17260, partial [Chitinophagaceae bacterium]|nr:hypothetical protein [Chitinophagaceae bacterium]
KDKVVKDQFKSKHVLPVCETFDRGAFDDLLSNPAVKGLRVYFGMTDDDQVNVIIVGVDEGGKDMLPSAEDAGTMRLASQDAPTDPIIENGVRCPTTCPPPSALNGGV